MPTVLLIRHGRTAANASGTLAGWTPGVPLDDTGRTQAEDLAARAAVLPLAAIVSSPLQRCLETTAELVAVPGPRGRPRPPAVVDDRLGECHYGDWTGRSLRDLVKDPLWPVVQAHPSAVTFPGEGGEPMLAMQQRAATAVREHDRRVLEGHGEEAVWAAVSHADVIKAVLADALGLHLDQFQRLVVDPCSVSVVHYTRLRPFVLRLNDLGADLSGLVPKRRRSRTDGRRRSRAGGAGESDAVVGGSAGHAVSDGGRTP